MGKALAATDGGRVIARRIAAGDAASIADVWRTFDARLMRNAGGANPFFLEAALRPALDAFARENVFLFCVFDAERLIGMAPFETARGYAHLPVKYVRTWRHPYCFFGEPNIEAGREADFFSALARYVDEHPADATFLRLEDVDVTGPASRWAESEKRQRLVYVADERNRASYQGGLDFDQYYSDNIRAKKRKEIRRLINRLTEHGVMRADQWRFGDALDTWIEDFLRLEGQGWKGKAGTSLGAKEKDAEFFRHSIRGMARAGVLLFQRLRVGDKTIAMLVNFVAGGVGYSFKICHDEAYERFSPGVLIELELMRYLSGRPDIVLFDSCAKENHPMIDALWAERRKIAGVNVSAKSFGRREMLHICALLESLSRRSKRPKKESSVQ